MNLNVIGLSNDILSLKNQLKIIPINKRICVFNKNVSKPCLIEKNKTHSFNIKEKNISNFIKSSKYLMIAIKNKKNAFNLVKIWNRHHNEGIIFFSIIVEISFINKIRKWLRMCQNNTEIIILPFIRNNNLNYLIASGNINLKYTKKFRKLIAKNKMPILFLSYKDIEKLIKVHNKKNVINNDLILQLGIISN